MRIGGCGMISPLGLGVEESYAAYCEGERNRDGLAVEFDIAEHLVAPKNYLDRASQLALCAVDLLCEHDEQLADLTAHGLYWSSAQGARQSTQRYYSDVAAKGPRFGKPILFPHTYANTAASLIAIDYRMGATHLNFTEGPLAGLNALIAAIEDGEEFGSCAVVGGCDTACSEGAAALSIARQGEVGLGAWFRGGEVDAFIAATNPDLILHVGALAATKLPCIDLQELFGNAGAATALLGVALGCYAIKERCKLGGVVPARIAIVVNDPDLGTVGVSLEQ